MAGGVRQMACFVLAEFRIGTGCRHIARIFCGVAVEESWSCPLPFSTQLTAAVYMTVKGAAQQNPLRRINVYELG
jgi:hypothetical protein